MQNTLILNTVGLTPVLLAQMPFLKRWAAERQVHTVAPTLPAVTCTVQATYYTGLLPQQHGIVGNGWYSREDGEVKFWKQSNRLVGGQMLWEKLKAENPAFTCANLFWWYNMNTTADWVVTPRPQYAADGQKFPDIYTLPAYLRDKLQQQLGTFPLFNFWGPRANITCTKWIAEATLLTLKEYHPTLALAYLPHLDYDLQRHGPNHPTSFQAARDLDTVLSNLIPQAEQQGYQVLVLSEYGITEVSQPVYLNRVLRQAGMIYTRLERGGEYFDPAGSAAFAVADHQIAHVYVNDPAKMREVRQLLEATPGIAQILSGDERQSVGLDHPRAGDFVCLAEPQAWFAYYYWLDDNRAPDYARMVDIHKKPGYDPVELFADPAISMLPLVVGGKLLKKKLGFRTLLNIIPLDATLVRGSHGVLPPSPGEGPLFIAHTKTLPMDTPPHVNATDVHDLILHTVRGR